MRPLRKLAVLLAPIVILCVAPIGRAGDDPKPTKPDAEPSKDAPSLSSEAENRAMALVRDHLPELADVLGPLKATNPAEYRKAVAELATEAKNLADLRVKNPARHDLALDAWKARSRVELIAAKLANAPSPEREAELRNAIEARVEVDLRRQRFEVEQGEAAVTKARDHLNRAEANRDRAKDALQRGEANRDARVEARFRALVLPKVPPTAKAKKSRTNSSFHPKPMPSPTLSATVVSMPSPILSATVVPMPSPSLPEGDYR